MSGLLSVLVVLAVVFVVWKSWKYLSATAQNSPRRTEAAEVVIATREVMIRKAIRNGYRSGKNIGESFISCPRVSGSSASRECPTAPGTLIYRSKN
jgi:Tfp pilus assembly protein PilW